MSLRNWFGLIFAFVCIGPARPSAATTHDMAPYVGSAQLEEMKKLAGDWKGTHQMGEEASPAEVQYYVTSNGSAVVEKLFPGTLHEMISVYHDKNGKLMMTHYCAMGNQPEMDLVASDDKHLEFSLSPNSTIDPAVEGHMHALTILLNDSGAIEQRWTFYENGQPSGTTVITLTKQ